MPSPLKQPCNSNIQSGEQLFYRRLFSSRLGAEQPACQLCFTSAVLLRCCWVSSTKTLQWTLLAFHVSLDIGQLAQRSLGVRKVLRSNYDLAAGKPWDTFHIFKRMTHCAAIDKLKTKFNASHGFSFVGGSKQGQRKTREKVQNETHQKKKQKKPERVPKKNLALCFNHLGGSRLVFGVRGVRVLP